jgi:hypothetical protein
MPNWCDGEVEVYGSQKDLEAILAQASKGTYKLETDWDSETRKYKNVSEQPNRFSFENFFPTPEELLVGEGWYNWRTANWGTKWDLSQRELSLGELKTSDDPSKPYEFYFSMGLQTAWSPAFGVFEKISEQYPDVHIEYKFVEEGMSFFGIATFGGGYLISEDTRDITTEDLKIAGCVLDSEGNVDWEQTDEYDLYLALDTWKEYDLETEGGKTNG